jgi:hypothetical protein
MNKQIKAREDLEALKNQNQGRQKRENEKEKLAH